MNPKNRKPPSSPWEDVPKFPTGSRPAWPPVWPWARDVASPSAVPCQVWGFVPEGPQGHSSIQRVTKAQSGCAGPLGVARAWHTESLWSVVVPMG